ncbi:hypothetical protein O3P69_014195 [Scylla paramamosain]|uniref:Uncharacterized protein n=1 Tax=Scylla paramamosain TaxID=85552 RepID=A0AAW0S9I9_SCYPA
MDKVHEVAFVFPTLFRLISGADSSTPSQINITPALQTHLFYILPPAPLRVKTLDSSRGPHFCKFLATVCQPSLPAPPTIHIPAPHRLTPFPFRRPHGVLSSLPPPTHDVRDGGDSDWLVGSMCITPNLHRQFPLLGPPFIPTFLLLLLPIPPLKHTPASPRPQQRGLTKVLEDHFLLVGWLNTDQ